MGEKEVLYYGVLEGDIQYWDVFCEAIDEFESGDDLEIENDEIIYKMIKKDNDLLRENNSSIKFYYHTLNKISKESGHGIIFVKDENVYNLDFDESSILNYDENNQELFLIYYKKDDIGTDLTTNYKYDSIKEDNFSESKYVEEIKTLFNFLLLKKKLRLKLLLNANNLGKKILESIDFKEDLEHK